MRELFVPKKPGDTLSAEEVNFLAGVSRAGIAGREGGGQFGYRGSFAGSAADQAHIEVLVVITSATVDDNDAVNSGRYLGRFRYFDHATELWEQEEAVEGGDANRSNTIEVDVRGFVETFDADESLFLLVGDILTVRYDEQRGVMVPVDPPTERRGVLDGILSYGGSATASIWFAGSDTTRNVTVYDDLLNTGQSVAASSKIQFGWREGKYYVTGAQCP